jgi:anti-sigma factor RsiW
MNHIDDDRLLEYALDLTDDENKSVITSHLSQCLDCTKRLAAMKADVGLLAGVSPRRPPVQMPGRGSHNRFAFRLMQAAAFIVLGFFGGLGAAGLMDRAPRIVSPLYADLSPLPDSLSNTAASDATQVTGQTLTKGE